MNFWILTNSPYSKFHPIQNVNLKMNKLKIEIFENFLEFSRLIWGATAGIILRGSLIFKISPKKSLDSDQIESDLS